MQFCDYNISDIDIKYWYYKSSSAKPAEKAAATAAKEAKDQEDD